MVYEMQDQYILHTDPFIIIIIIIIIQYYYYYYYFENLYVNVTMVYEMQDQYILHTAEAQNITLSFACRHGTFSKHA